MTTTAYPDGVHLDRIWARHAAEIERQIPRFAQTLAEERTAAVRARQYRAAVRTAALDWAADTCDWRGDLDHLAAIAAELAGRAEGAHARARAKDGFLDARELAAAEELGARARALREFIAERRAAEAASAAPDGANGRTSER